MQPNDEVIVTRKTRKGAENYIRNSLGFEPGVWQDDTRWNGSESLPIRIVFRVSHVPGSSEYKVVRGWFDVTCGFCDGPHHHRDCSVVPALSV